MGTTIKYEQDAQEKLLKKVKLQNNTSKKKKYIVLSEVFSEMIHTKPFINSTNWGIHLREWNISSFLDILFFLIVSP